MPAFSRAPVLSSVATDSVAPSATVRVPPLCTVSVSSRSPSGTVRAVPWGRVSGVASSSVRSPGSVTLPQTVARSAWTHRQFQSAWVVVSAMVSAYSRALPVPSAEKLPASAAASAPPMSGALSPPRAVRVPLCRVMVPASAVAKAKGQTWASPVQPPMPAAPAPPVAVRLPVPVRVSEAPAGTSTPAKASDPCRALSPVSTRVGAAPGSTVRPGPAVFCSWTVSSVRVPV